MKLHGGWISPSEKQDKANLRKDCSVERRLVSTVKRFAALSKVEPGFEKSQNMH